MELHPSVVDAASWKVATLLVRRHPELEVIRMHPSGGQADALSVVSPHSEIAQLNRVGAIHFQEHGGDAMLAWERALEDGLLALVERIERAAGLHSVGKLPVSTPGVLVYRVLSALISLSVFSRRTDACMAFIDTSGYGGGPADWVERFPEVQQRIEDRRRTPPEPWGDNFWDPGYTFWHASAKGMTLALDTVTGDAWSAAGRTVNLAKIYNDVGRSMPRLLAAVLDLGADR